MTSDDREGGAHTGGAGRDVHTLGSLVLLSHHGDVVLSAVVGVEVAGSVLADDADVHAATGAQIVVDTGRYSVRDQLLRLLLLDIRDNGIQYAQVFFVVGL